MSLETKIFEFDRFILDLSDRTLYRDGRSVNLSIKAFEILCVLFENRPHVVEKRALMDAVWADSFVEEGNLTFTISQLRRSLEDSKRDPKIIETVHRRGYRFIADAREHSESGTPERRIARGDGQGARLRWAALAAVLFIVLGIGGFMIAGRSRSAPPILAKPISLEKLSTNGKVAHAVISRDGKFVLYTNGIGQEQQSVWLRQLDSGSNVEIIKPSDHQYLGLALSPDGNFMYFARKTWNSWLTIYRLSIFGGIPAKIAEGTEGWMSISPDGSLISFVKCPYTREDSCSLYVADALDGKNERRLVTYAEPIRIGDNDFAPDGRSIAFAYGQTNAGEDDFRLGEVEIAGGARRDLSPHRFFNIKSVLWLPDKTGWLITANRRTEAEIPILHLPADGGMPARLTHDSETYSAMSASSNFSALLATQVRRDTALYVVETDSGREYNLGGPASTVTISAGNRVYFSSESSGNPDIWSANADGSDPKQLTSDPGTDSVPLVSPDNKSVFFSSTRSGEPHIWRMNADGGDQTRLTAANGGWPIFVTADGVWLYFRHWGKKTLWRVSTLTGSETEVLPRQASRFSISPNGSTVLISNPEDNPAKIEIIDLETGRTMATYQLSDKNARILECAWMSDGRSIVYMTRLEDGTKDVWRQPAGGGAPQRIKRLSRTDQVHSFALAPDGRYFAVVQGSWKHDAALIMPASR